MTQIKSNPYVPTALDAWIAEKQPTLAYTDGSPIEFGDQVDFGLDPQSIGIAREEGPWVGHVLGVVLSTGRVLVDTFCNSVEPYPAEELKLLGRSSEEGKEQLREMHKMRAAKEEAR